MKKDRDDELEREIRTHLDLEVEERVADGMSEIDARYAARRAFGNVTRTQEDVRAVWTRRSPRRDRPGCPLRAPHPAQESRICKHRRADHRPGDRRVDPMVVLKDE
jgi:hypothetical protein